MKNVLKKVTALAVTSAIALGAVGCGGSGTPAPASPGASAAPGGGSGQAIKVSLSHNSSAESPWEVASKKFAEMINTESKGKFAVQTFPNGILFQRNWKIMLEMTQSGSSQIGLESITALASEVPQLEPMQLPFLFDNDEHIIKFLETNPPILQKWYKSFEDKNMVVIASAPRKFRQIINNKVLIKTPEDLKGLKFRVPNNPFFVKVFELIGAKPVPMSSGEIYSAIQLGTVVGEDNSLPVVYDFKTHEVAKNMTLWNYMADASILFMNKDFYNSLSDEDKALFKKAGEEWAKVNIAEDTSYQEKAKAEMEKAGVKFHVMTDEEKKPFKEMVQPLYEETKTKTGAADWDEFMKAVDEARK